MQLITLPSPHRERLQANADRRDAQQAHSHVGAIGIMQLMPGTGKMDVGSISVAEANIQAGAKYMDQFMTKYFADAHFTESDRSLFAFASYKAGPANIAKMRQLAAQRGLAPNKWFNNDDLRRQHLQVLRRV